MNPLSLPQARIPLGYVMVNGQRLPVEIDPEWMRAFLTLVARSGGVLGIDDQGTDVFSTSFTQVDYSIGVNEISMSGQTFAVEMMLPDITQSDAGNTVERLVLKAGTVALPSLTFEGDTNTGIYSPAADVLAITTGGVERIRFNTANTEIAGFLRLGGVTSTGVTGTGKVVFDTSPILVTPNLGTPSTLVGTNITGTAAGLSVNYATTAGSAPTTGFSGTVSPVTSITVLDGLVTAAS